MAFSVFIIYEVFRSAASYLIMHMHSHSMLLWEIHVHLMV